MTSETTFVQLEKTRQIANLAQSGQLSLAISHLVDVGRKNMRLYESIVQSLESYLEHSVCDELDACARIILE